MILIKYTKALFKVIGILVGVFVLFFTGCILFPYHNILVLKESGNSVLIQNVNIIDVEKDSILTNHHLLIVNGVIDSISDKPISSLDDQVTIVDATHKYLISGFWDMHVHLSRHSPFVEYPEFICHGVTHVRDMRGPHNDRDPFAVVQEKLSKWNNKVLSGELIGPQLHSYTSFVIEGPNPMYKNLPAFFNCATPADAVKLVDHFKKNNINLIKIYNNIPREAFIALMTEAKKAGIDVAGHKPLRVTTIEAADAGMKSLEHARFFIWDSFEGSKNLLNDQNPESWDNTEFRRKMLEKHDTLLLENLFQAFVRNNTFYCPTHLTRKSDAFADDSLFRLRYNHINPILRFLSFEDLEATIQEDPTDEGRKVYKEFYLKGLEISGKAAKSSVKIMAGSDVPELPGSSLHDELIELSKAGLSPYEVLRTTTLYPSIYYGLSDKYGSVQKGKYADLVLLSKNPIDDINNVRDIYGVINNGIFFNLMFIQELQEQVQERRNGIIMSCKLILDIMIYMTL